MELKQEIQLEIVNLFRERKYQQVLALVQKYQKQFEFAPEIMQLIEKAGELLTAQNFIDKLSDDFQALLRDGDCVQAGKVLDKLRSIDPTYPDLTLYEKRLNELNGAFSQEDRSGEYNVEILLDEALIFFYQNDWRRALVSLNNIVAREPAHAKAKDLIEKCRENLKKADQTVPEVSPASLDTRKLKAVIEPEDANSVALDDILKPIVNGLTEDAETEQASSDSNMKESTFESLSPTRKPGFSFSQVKPGTLGKKPDQYSIGDLQLEHKKVQPRVSESNTVTINIFYYVLGFLAILTMVILCFSYFNQNYIRDNTKRSQVEYMINQARAEIENREFASARDIYQNILTIQPGYKKVDQLLKELDNLEQKHMEEMVVLSQDYLREAKRYIRMGNFEEAKRYLGLAREANPQNLDLPEVAKLYEHEYEKYQTRNEEKQAELREKVRNLQIEVDYYIREDDLEKARTKLSQILLLEPDNVLAIEMHKEISARIRKRDETDHIDYESEKTLRELRRSN
ncbi:hypothetical protein JXQ70_00420 [bacterium]|nr:hypothetical protein [bacterium]